MIPSRMRRWLWLVPVLAILVLPEAGLAGEEEAKPVPGKDIIMIDESAPDVIANTVWTFICGVLVFFMNAGFGALETGLCRRKNAVNILAKNFIVFGVSSAAFWFVGFGLMFGNGSSFIGQSGFMPTLMETAANPTDEMKEQAVALAKAEATAAGKEFTDEMKEAAQTAVVDKQAEYTFSSLNWANLPISVKFFFQLVFAGTAATIVSGAVAERIKFATFIVFSFLLVAFVYPVTGHWVWGGGWLSTFTQGDQSVPFHDFAGSGVVHSVGGWAALAGIILLGPRIGKYTADGRVNPLPGHSMALAAIGCFILWLGWFGFNPGSTMGAISHLGHIAVTTNTAAAFGSLFAAATSWLVLGKPDFSMILNGCLAGLVAITAPCAVVSVGGAAIIGACGGVLVVFSVLFWDKLKIDDPVGALSVHLVAGTFGLLAVGLFAAPSVLEKYGMGAYCQPGLFMGGGPAQLVTQLVGLASIGGYVMAASLIIWAVLKATIGLRVSAAEEVAGLDIGEHGMEAYPGFAVDSSMEPTVTTQQTGPGVRPATA